MTYYVYELIDPRDSQVFYVGKGQRERYLDHLREARSGKRSRKCDTIRAILVDQLEYEWRIVDRFLDEQAAYDAEAAVVDHHGLENLTNVLPGGGKAWEAYQRVRREKAAPTPFDIVRTCRKSLFKALVAKAIGLKVMMDDFDFVEVGFNMAQDLKAKVGDDYFYQYVPRFHIASVA